VRGFLDRLAGIGAGPRQDPEQRLRAGALILAAIVVTALSTVWVATYGAFGYWRSAAIPLAYQVASVAGLLMLARTKNFPVFRATQLSMWLILPAALQISLGGFVASSGIVLWSVIAPLGAIAMYGVRGSVPWILAFLLLVAALAVADPILAADAPSFSARVTATFAVLNIAGLTISAYALLAYFVERSDQAQRELAAEQERSEALLRNVLPEPIAGRLKAGEGLIADRFDEVTVLFADLVGFTAMSASLPPAQVVVLLDRIFTTFDAIADAEGLEKIKTIGDAYMLVGGAPDPRADHAAAVARVALAMLDAVAADPTAQVAGMSIRIGIDTGPAVAGVIGQRKFSYDVWGDTVNTASRMESHGVPGRIHLSARAAAALGEGFDVQPRGVIEVKGKGPMQTFFLCGPSPARARDLTPPSSTPGPSPTSSQTPTTPTDWRPNS
jgi:guanylate cyclase